MGEQPPFAGLGKLYICRVEDLEKNPNTPMKLLGEAVKIEPGMLRYNDEPSPSYEPKGFTVTGNAILKEPSRELIEKLWETSLVDVTLNRKPGRMPRKMKKAYRSDFSRNTKWKRKVANYMRRLSMTLHNAEVVITKEQRDCLSLQIKSSQRQ